MTVKFPEDVTQVVHSKNMSGTEVWFLQQQFEAGIIDIEELPEYAWADSLCYRQGYFILGDTKYEIKYSYEPGAGVSGTIYSVQKFKRKII